MSPSNAEIERVFQLACNRMREERREGLDGLRFFAAANAIQDAWPEVIEPYCERMGVQPCRGAS